MTVVFFFFFLVLKFVPDGNYANYESLSHFIFLLLLFVYIWHLEVLKRSKSEKNYLGQ